MRWSSLMSTSAFLFMPIQQSTKKAERLRGNTQLLTLYSDWESNPDQRFRKPPFYPLNYQSPLRLPACKSKQQPNMF